MSSNIFSTNDTRLNTVMHRSPLACATVEEYAAFTGIDVIDILGLFSPHLDAGTISLETVGSVMFVNTAPSGRPATSGHPAPSANLWEILRTGRSQVEAHSLWALTRSLEATGWTVELRPSSLAAAVPRLATLPEIGLLVQGRIAPLEPYPMLSMVSDPNGRLTDLARAGALLVAVATPSGGLDDYVTAARSWLAAVPAARMGIMLVEAPSFMPVFVSGNDAAVAARHVSVREVSW